MTDDVFAGDQPSASVLDELVGEGKKFDSVEALAKGKMASDDHIARIEQENADLKAKLETAGGTTIEEIQARLQQLAETKQEGSKGEQTMSSDDLEQTIRDVITTVTDADTKASNRAKGNALVLSAVDGDADAARALVAERSARLGMSPAKLAELSEQSPDAFAELMQLKDSGPAPSQTTSVLPGQRTDALEQNQAVMEIDGFKTKAWFDAKKKEVGHVKFLNDQSIQRELNRSINGLGSRYY
jgi:hypothetical protein